MLFLLFHLDADRYAFPARDAIEVLPLVALKEIPGAPRGLAGLMDFRGTLVPVVDLSALALGRPAARRVSTRLLMVRHAPEGRAPRVLGLIAERATEMLRREETDFRPAGLDLPRARYLGPVTSDAHGLVQRVELGALLDHTDVQAALFAAEGAAS